MEYLIEISTKYTQNVELMAKAFELNYEVFYTIYANEMKNDKKEIEIQTKFSMN